MSCNQHHMLAVHRIREFVSANKFYLYVALTLMFFYFSIMLFFPRTLLADPDTMWHIRTGQWILHHAQVPTVDFYSYTATGMRWISTEWLSEIFLALSFEIAEWHGVVILSAIACATIVAIICFHLVRNLRFSIAI